MSKIALFNAKKFKAVYSDSNSMNYIIVITDNNLPCYKQMPKLIPLNSSKYADLTYIFSENANNILSKYENHDLQLEITWIPAFGPLYNLF